MQYLHMYDVSFENPIHSNTYHILWNTDTTNLKIGLKNPTTIHNNKKQ